jgi:hypothetical protein
MNNQFDDSNAYCRGLGHYVPFRYCRTVSDGLPCSKIKDCWFEKIDIARFISDNYTEPEQKRIFAPPPEKISTILDLINKTRES